MKRLILPPKDDRRLNAGAICGLCTQRDGTIVRKQFPEKP